jgi:hypothetical protein
MMANVANPACKMKPQVFQLMKVSIVAVVNGELIMTLRRRMNDVA